MLDPCPNPVSEPECITVPVPLRPKFEVPAVPEPFPQQCIRRKSVLRIRTRIRIRMFLGLLAPDPLVRGMDLDTDPPITKQKEKP
jgi:hypothetical protein